MVSLVGSSRKVGRNHRTRYSPTLMKLVPLGYLFELFIRSCAKTPSNIRIYLKVNGCGVG